MNDLADERRINGAPRRRATRLEAEPSTGAGSTRAVIVAQLRREAADYGVEGLIDLTDAQLAVRPGSVSSFSRWLFESSDPADPSDMRQLVHLVAGVCMRWAEVQGVGSADEVIRRCGLDRMDGQLKVTDRSTCWKVSMLVAHRLALSS